MPSRSVLYASMTAAAMLLAACAGAPTMPERAAPITAETQAWRAEPVIYNGRRYRVAFRKRADGRYDVRISAPGRRLGHTAGDGRIMRAVAEAAVHHFHCRSSQEVRLRNLRPEKGRWLMEASCS